MRSWRPLSRAGVIAACTLGSLAVLPSLVPRAGLIQGLLLGSCAAIGYLLGTLLGLRWPRTAGRYDLWWLVLPVIALAVGWRWQADLAELTGVPRPPLSWIAIAMATSILVFLLWLALARSVRWLTQRLSRLLKRALPHRAAAVTAAAVAALMLVVGVMRLPDVLVAALHPLFSAQNDHSDLPAPSSRYLSGGPASTLAWQDLGAQGQQFVVGVTPTSKIELFNSRPALAPIRAFVGVDSAPSDEQRAALAVAELERLGGFQRAVIAVGTSAGSGTVDPGEVMPIEYMLNGNVATVSTQYSLLPSFLSFLVDQPNAIEAASTLLTAIQQRAEQEPRPPRIVVFGESLGAYGSSSAFPDLQAVLAGTAGALWQGPPNSSRLWRRYTAERDPDSPQVQPVLDQGRHLRWANQPSALDLSTPWARPRVVFLQNASDPVVWWSFSTLLVRPDWLAEPRGPGVLSWVPWLPVITFAGLTGDMINSQGVPAGHGHVYGTDPVFAWAAILQPPGWTDEDTTRLARQGG